MDIAWNSYLNIEPTKQAHANAEMLDFAATATWKNDLPDWATATYGDNKFLTSTPAWFSELHKDVQYQAGGGKRVGVDSRGSDGHGSKGDCEGCFGCVGRCGRSCCCDVAIISCSDND